MSWAAELLTELCRAGSHLHLHPWRCIVKSRVLRISGAFLLFFFFFLRRFHSAGPHCSQIHFLMKQCPVSQHHHRPLERETAFTFGVSDRWEHC